MDGKRQNWRVKSKGKDAFGARDFAAFNSSKKSDTTLPVGRRNENTRPITRSIKITRRSHNSHDFMNPSFLRQLIDNNDCEDLLSSVCSNVAQYVNMIQNTLKSEILPDVVEMVAKLCESTFVANKYKILSITLCDNFFEVAQCYISSLILDTKTPHTAWKHFEKCLSDLVTIFEHALNLMPRTCWYNLQRTVELIDINIGLIEKEKDVLFSDECKAKIVQLTEVILKLEAKYGKKDKKIAEKEEEEEKEPDDDYRFIRLYPSIKELVVPERNFVRKNVTSGNYKNVHHYLDVQFRLLREDFLNPIREDICDYINQVNRTLFNIKIHKNVQFISRDINKTDICYKVKIPITKKLENSIVNGKSKRFMHGSLIIFTNDDFKSMICGKVVKADRLLQGEILVSTIDYETPEKNVSYEMVECIIYFEPYYQVLSVLQHLPDNVLPMEKYILNVNTYIDQPQYLSSEQYLPSSVGLNPSQLAAINAAFKQEFVVIQGPPGTGKTFLGLRIIKNLLRITRKRLGPMLIVCYTNHALDQFLEGLLDTTRDIIRIGAQSNSERLKPYSLHSARMRRNEELKNNDKRTLNQGMLRDLYTDVNNAQYDVKLLQGFIQQFDNMAGIIHFELIKQYVHSIRYTGFDDFSACDFVCWLLEENVGDYTEDNSPLVTSDRSEVFDLFENILSFYITGTFSLNELTISDMNRIKVDLINEIDCFKLEYVEGTNEGIDNLVQIQMLEEFLKLTTAKITYMRECLENEYEPLVDNIDLDNPFDMAPQIRWRLYKSWFTELRRNMEVDVVRKANTYAFAFRQLDDFRQDEDVILLNQMQVVGMTTTCAARLRSVIEQLKSPIVVIEEAAEVLEAHIVTALTVHCQHLILIGDHKQLKPSTSDYLMNKKFKLGTSLFERMVLNDIRCHTLNVQHRMRPEISELISPAIYPDLINHESVYSFPPVLGIDRSVYFIDHLESEQDFGDSSKYNIHEARFLLKLTEYLLKNGYSEEDITILAAYTGQVYTLQKEMSYSNDLRAKQVHITAVDNFQGEENKIILLSLVRNNPENVVGFLSIENRVCVALSRAKEGLYIMGNMTQLCTSSEVWKSINKTLQEQNSVGNHLPLRCKTHDKQTLVKLPTDFQKCPNGGCSEICDVDLACGHKCTYKCHNVDLDHEYTKCHQPCNKSLCDKEDHICKKICYQECGPCEYLILATLLCGHDKQISCHLKINLGDIVCNQMVSVLSTCGHTVRKLCGDDLKCMQKVSIELPCNHTQQIECHMKDKTDSWKCNEPVSVLSSCGHVTEKLCHVPTNTIQCPYPCDVKLPKCDHPCSQKCHKNKNPAHVMYWCPIRGIKEHYQCTMPYKKHKSNVACGSYNEPCSVLVTKIRSCSHMYFKIKCHVNVDDIPCIKKCKKRLECGHQCPKECREHGSCGPCTKTLTWVSECGHRLAAQCGTRPDRNTCRNPCKKRLDCGHKCTKLCNQPCTDMCVNICSKLLECGHRCINRCSAKDCACRIKIIPECGHEIKARCEEVARRENCLEACSKILDCGHDCEEMCNALCTSQCLKLTRKKLECGHSVIGVCYKTKECTSLLCKAKNSSKE